jgi:AcrR family transcriptional regulator
MWAPLMQKRAYHHGDLRSALLDCARRIIHEEGIDQVSLREVARRLGVSHGAPAHHFKNKKALLTALAVQGYERLAETVIAELSAAPGKRTKDPRRQLEVIGRAYVRFAVENPDHFSMMFEQVRLDEKDVDLMRASETCYGLLVRTVHACKKAGYLGARSPETTAVAAWSLVHGLAKLWNDGRLDDRVSVRDASVMAESVCRLFVDGLMKKGLR